MFLLLFIIKKLIVDGFSYSVIATNVKVGKMILYYKYIKQMIAFIIINVLFISANASASECGVLRLQNNRSTGVNVKENKCNEHPYIAIGTIIDLAAKGRLWLKSNQSPVIGSEFQMICQNETGRPVELEFSDMLTPWLSQGKLNDCSGWVNKKLSCEVKMGERNGLYCVLAFFQPDVNNKLKQVERSTSVKLRGSISSLEFVNTFSSTEKQQLFNTIEPELDLCKQLNQITTDIKVSWSVDKDAEVKRVNVSIEPLNDYLSECVKAVINTIQYPILTKAVEFEHYF